MVAIAIQLTVVGEDFLAAWPRAQPAARLVSVARVPSAVDLGQIVAAHLFGVGRPPVDTSGADAPATSVALTLTGLISGDTPADGNAIVGPKGEATRLVRVGQEVAPGVTLQGVYTDHVVLNRAGSLESLALPHGPSGVLLAAARTHIDGQSAPAEADSGEEGDGPNAEQLSKRIEAATAGLSQVLSAHGAFEGAEDGGGAYRGVIVQPGGDTELFSQLGFHPGDMITHINGIALDDPSMLSMLKSGGVVRVGVRRSSGAEEISVNTTALRAVTN